MYKKKKGLGKKKTRVWQFDEYKFILKDKKPVPCKSVLKWGAWIQENNPPLAKERVGNKEVSTVFLGMNHNIWGGKRHLFETMVFSTRVRRTNNLFGKTRTSYDDYTRRYSTWREAMKGHKEVVGKVRLDNL